MALGRGKYEGIAMEIAERFGAHGVIIAIINGNKGTGIELYGPAIVHEGVPDFLEALAKDIREAAKRDAATIRAKKTPN
jgi:hypothetical protein